LVLSVDQLIFEVEELAQHGFLDRIRFSALREKGKLDPEGLAGEAGHHGACARAAWFVAIEQDGEVAHAGARAMVNLGG
jgi:hypothetical protein